MINNQFDTLLPFIHALISICRDKITDYMFSKACEEFNLDENDAMDLMSRSHEYEFIRICEGWTIKKR